MFVELTWVSVTLKLRCVICELWRGLNSYQTHINYLLREKKCVQLSRKSLCKFATKFMYGLTKTIELAFLFTSPSTFMGTLVCCLDIV